MEDSDFNINANKKRKLDSDADNGDHGDYSDDAVAVVIDPVVDVAWDAKDDDNGDNSILVMMLITGLKIKLTFFVLTLICNLFVTYLIFTFRQNLLDKIWHFFLVMGDSYFGLFYIYRYDQTFIDVYIGRKK